MKFLIPAIVHLFNTELEYNTTLPAQRQIIVFPTLLLTMKRFHYSSYSTNYSPHSCLDWLFLIRIKQIL